jgi:hypothetical protein
MTSKNGADFAHFVMPAFAPALQNAQSRAKESRKTWWQVGMGWSNSLISNTDDKGNPVNIHDPPSVFGLLYEIADSLEIIAPMFSSPHCGRLGWPPVSPPPPRRHLAKPPPLSPV